MTSRDAIKLLVWLAIILLAVAGYCFARVDLGLSLAQINHIMQAWHTHTVSLTLTIWSGLITALMVTGVVSVMTRKQ